MRESGAVKVAWAIAVSFALAAVLVAPAGAAGAVNFGAPTSFNADMGMGGKADDLVADDFDDDGYPDVAATSSGWGFVSVLFGSPGSFAAPIDLTAESGDDPEWGLASGNLGGGYRPELINEDGNVWMNDSVNTPADPFFYDYDNEFAGSGGMALGSLNSGSDAFLDAAVATASTDVEVYTGNANDTFSAAPSNIPVADSNDVVIANFNPDEDSFQDVAVSTYPADDVYVVPGNGDGTFDSPVLYDAGPGQWVLRATDVNSDSDVDLLVSDETDQDVRVFLGQAGSAFSAGTSYPAGDSPYGLGVGDFDGDGDEDLAVGDIGGNDVKVLEGDGTGSFGAPVSFPLGSSAGPLVVDDFGGDERPDVAVATGDGDVKLLLAEDPTPPADPPPVFQKTVNAKPVSGTVTYTCPGSPKAPLSEPSLISINCEVDARAGRMTLTSADSAGNLQSADFYGGSFRIGQVVERSGKKKNGPPETITVLTLTGPLKCKGKGKGKAAVASGSGPIAYAAGGRGLWGTGRGRFRTRGNRGSATVRGTTWFTKDTCAGTLAKVVEGTVVVDDFAKKKDIVLGPGESYLARKPKKGRQR